jgi:hypothetical protein
MSNKRQEKIIAEIYSAAGRYVIGAGKRPKLSGDPDQVRIINRATVASRRLYESLCSGSASLEAITVMMEEKKSAAAEFEKYFGTPWLL